MALQVRAKPFQSYPFLQMQLLMVASPVESGTVRQERHWFIPDTRRYPAFTSHIAHLAASFAELHET
jgi:hypothetical protein